LDREDVKLEQPLAASGPALTHRRHVPPLYGVMAEFENPSDLVHAAHKTYEAGYRRINGYSPYPIEELSEAIGFFFALLFLFIRFLPMISIFEMRTILPEAEVEEA